MRYPKLRELKEAVTALFKGPYTSKYPAQPFTPAKRFRGKPVPSQNGVGCKACAEVCPARAIEVRDTIVKGKATREMILHLDECHFCGQCELNCTTRLEDPPGVKLNTEFELAGFSRNEMVTKTGGSALVRCEV